MSSSDGPPQTVDVKIPQTRNKQAFAHSSESYQKATHRRMGITTWAGFRPGTMHVAFQNLVTVGRESHRKKTERTPVLRTSTRNMLAKVGGRHDIDHFGVDTMISTISGRRFLGQTLRNNLAGSVSYLVNAKDRTITFQTRLIPRQPRTSKNPSGGESKGLEVSRVTGRRHLSPRCLKRRRKKQKEQKHKFVLEKPAPTPLETQKRENMER